MQREDDICSFEFIELEMILGYVSGNFYQVIGNMIW